MTEWASYHIFCFNPKNMDEVIRMIHNYCSKEKNEGKLLKWFYIRYWDGGPHVRLRILKQEQETPNILLKKIQRYIGENPSEIELTSDQYYSNMENFKENGDEMSEWFEDGMIISKKYVPEVERYGGSELMEVTEELFMLSSELAYAIQKNSSNFSVRLLLMYCVVEKLIKNFKYSNEQELVELMRGVVDFWAERNLQSTAPIVSFYNKNQKLLNKIRISLLNNQEIAYKFEEIKERIKIVENQTKDVYYFNSIMISHIHMLCNRTGTTPVYEPAIYQLLTERNWEENYYVMGL